MLPERFSLSKGGGYTFLVTSGKCWVFPLFTGSKLGNTQHFRKMKKKALTQPWQLFATNTKLIEKNVNNVLQIRQIWQYFSTNGYYRLRALPICYYRHMDKHQIKTRVSEVINHDPNKQNIRSISLFGSFLHGDFTAASNVDLLVELNEAIGVFPLMTMQNNLEDRIGRPVQLLTKNSISRYFSDDVVREAERIY